MTRLLVGLGNPGPEYEGTRHNVGFRVVEEIALHEGVLFESASSLDGYGGPRSLRVARLHDPDALLLLPGSFMNRSGEIVEPVAKWLGFESAPEASVPGTSAESESDSSHELFSGNASPTEAMSKGRPPTYPAEVLRDSLMVVYDDLDLPPSELRIRAQGGHGGHNGMRSIVNCLGTNSFPRLRVGIGRPRTDAARHVLEAFDANEQEDMAIAVAEAAEACLWWLRNGDISNCMTRFHSRWTQAT